MNSIKRPFQTFAAMLALTLSAGIALAQHDHDQPPPQSKQPSAPAKPDSAASRAGDPYPLDMCPITGKKLGTMGDPVVKLYDGREVRFCCPACPEKFEKDFAASLAKIDEKLVKDQGPLYPLKTSLITGKELPAKPYEFVYGNRLIRLGAESEKTDFLKDPTKHMAALNKAAIEQQGANYPLAKCPASGDAYGGDMGKPVDLVVAGRLIRLCCNDCKKDVEKEPAKFVAQVDAARHGHAPDHDDKHNDDHKSHDHH